MVWELRWGGRWACPGGVGIPGLPRWGGWAPRGGIPRDPGTRHGVRLRLGTPRGHFLLILLVSSVIRPAPIQEEQVMSISEGLEKRVVK